MSPTVFREGPFRFFFFSREERRMHVHIIGPNGEAKFWIEPDIALAEHSGLDSRTLTHIENQIRGRIGEIIDAWNRHFAG
jgi:hypothetical protein